jgi:hypothetical protein
VGAQGAVQSIEEMDPSQLLVLTAMQMEADAITAGRGSGSFDIAIIGPGASRIPNLDRNKYGAILLAGIGGGLDPSLQCGDVVIDEASDLQCGDLPFRHGKIHTADRIIATPQQKLEILEKTGAVVVDMENAIVRKRANDHRILFLGLRVIGDCAADTLDPIVLTLIDENGRPKTGVVASALIRRPMLLRDLLHLRSRTKIALESLSRAVTQVLKAMNR